MLGIAAEGEQHRVRKTNIDMGEPIHAHWQTAIANASPLTLCVRRDAHEFVEGYPEASEFKYDWEDTFYMHMLALAYNAAYGQEMTVLYVRRPGNALDQRLRYWKQAPGQWTITYEEGQMNQVRLASMEHFANFTLVRKLNEYQFESTERYAIDQSFALVDPLAEPLAHEYAVRLNRFLTVFPVRFKHWMVMPMSILDVIVVGCRPRATLTVLATMLYTFNSDPDRVLLILPRHCPHASMPDAARLAALFPMHKAVSLTVPSRFAGTRGAYIEAVRTALYLAPVWASRRKKIEGFRVWHHDHAAVMPAWAAVQAEVERLSGVPIVEWRPYDPTANDDAHPCSAMKMLFEKGYVWQKIGCSWLAFAGSASGGNIL